jgi:hypothetical protein
MRAKKGSIENLLAQGVHTTRQDHLGMIVQLGNELANIPPCGEIGAAEALSDKMDEALTLEQARIFQSWRHLAPESEENHALLEGVVIEEFMEFQEEAFALLDA